ncbi:MAG: MFS transporter [Dehalococcoidales bacterium]|nr:MFS transporter [Dehalococcoidales bacterium]
MSGLLPIFVLAHFSHHFTAAIFQPLTPFIRDDFNLDYTQMGWMMSAFNIAYGVSHLPAGWFSDRLGPRMMITIGISGVALFAILIGIAPTYLAMAIFLVLLGVMGGGYHPAAAPLVAASVDERNRGRALGLHQIGGTASFFLTPLIAAAIFHTLSWRGTIISLAIPAFIIGIVLFVLLGRRGYAQKAPPVDTSRRAETRETPSNLRRLIPFITLGVALQVLILSAISYIALFAVDDLKASEETGAFLFAIFHFAGLWAGPVGGYLSDRLGTVPVMLVVSIIAGPALYLLSLTSLGWSVWLVLFVLGICMYIAMPVTEAHIITHAPERRRSTVLGIYYFASRGGAGLIIPVVGILADRFSFDTSFTIVGGAVLGVTLICSVFLRGSRG